MNPERKIKLIGKCSLPDDMPIICLPGRITRWKGQKFLLESLKLLPHRNFFCIFVGDDSQHGGFAAELRKAISQMGLEENCRLVGNILDMPALYMLSSIVISASTRPEAFGRVAVEAMAMGRPVIATDIGASQETVKDGETGWLVPVQPKSMAEKNRGSPGDGPGQAQRNRRCRHAPCAREFRERRNVPEDDRII